MHVCVCVKKRKKDKRRKKKKKESNENKLVYMSDRKIDSFNIKYFYGTQVYNQKNK